MQLAGARTTARVAVALALAAAVLLPGLPARAAGCAGVTAVVDFGVLGGGVQQKCVADGAGRPAWDVFDDAGFTLTPVTQYPGAVCQVLGKPASDCYRMPPANAYWGLFWSDGGGWVYSTKGARSLTVPAGGSVGLAWQNSTAQRAPGASPAPSSPSPTPTKAPTKKATTSTTKTSAKPRPAATSAAPSVTATSSAAANRSATASPSASASATTAAPAAPVTTTGTSPSAGPTSATAAGPLEDRTAADRSGGRLPWFVPAGVLVLLAGGAGGVTWWRRRTSG